MKAAEFISAARTCSAIGLGSSLELQFALDIDIDDRRDLSVTEIDVKIHQLPVAPKPAGQIRKPFELVQNNQPVRHFWERGRNPERQHLYHRMQTETTFYFNYSLQIRTENSMKTQNISQLIVVGELAVAMFRLEQESRSRRYDYLEKIKEFENSKGEINGRLDPRDPAHARAISFTKFSFDEYRSAKRAVYNVKRRLDNAAKRVRG